MKNKLKFIAVGISIFALFEILVSPVSSCFIYAAPQSNTIYLPDEQAEDNNIDSSLPENEQDGNIDDANSNNEDDSLPDIAEEDEKTGIKDEDENEKTGIEDIDNSNEEENNIDPQAENKDPEGENSNTTDINEENANMQTDEALGALKQIVQEYPVVAFVYLTDEYAVRTQATNESEQLVTLYSGHTVFIEDIFVNEKYEAWAYVSFEHMDIEYKGYVLRNNLACADERFLAWEEMYPVAVKRMTMRSAAVNALGSDIAQFPVSYQAALSKLKSAHPNWTFVKVDAAEDWNTVVRQELVGARSLIADSFPAHMKNGVYGQGWSYASETALKYYLDPRNWLNEEYIFQFEQLSYHPSYHTKAGVDKLLTGTFMANTVVPQDSITYGQLFFNRGSELGVSPYHLACRVIFEQGVGGTSALISGTYPGYESLYNFYNISASGSTNTQVVVNGLTRARTEGWTTRTSSINGGANLISANYVQKGQDTIYLQKFHVVRNSYGLYNHQYMQSVYAPSVEGKKLMQLYKSAGAIDNNIVFKIPVYENMPGSPCSNNAPSNEISLTPPAGYNDATIYLDGVAYKATGSGGRYTVKAPNHLAKTAVMYKYNAAGVPTGMYVWTLDYANSAYTVTAQPSFENMLTYHGFSVRVTGKTGIRFKSGIAKSVRAGLVTTGINGFKMTEYGTLVMSNNNIAQYPFVKGGTKVSSSVAYGMSGGKKVDIAYALVDGRYHYTSVLVGLPQDQYDTQFAFRGYAVIEKGGVSRVVYGPPVAKSLYEISKGVISSGQYSQGSAEGKFLQSIVSYVDNKNKPPANSGSAENENTENEDDKNLDDNGENSDDNGENSDDDGEDSADDGTGNEDENDDDNEDDEGDNGGEQAENDGEENANAAFMMSGIWPDY